MLSMNRKILGKRMGLRGMRLKCSTLLNYTITNFFEEQQDLISGRKTKIMSPKEEISYGSRWHILAFLLFLYLFAVFGPVQAQPSGTVQLVSEYIDVDSGDIYTLPNLTQGEMLYVYAKGTSGNLDPLIGLSYSNLTKSAMLSYFRETAKQNLAQNKDPLKALSEMADRFFLKWNDDVGTGYDSAFQYKIPIDGDYKLLIISSLLNQTFGDYEMLIGIASPQVLTGNAEPTNGAKIAFLKAREDNSSIRVQELNGSVEDDKPVTTLHLNRFEANDTLYAFVEAKSGDLAPILELKDYGNKTLATGNWEGKARNATLQYTFGNDSKNNYLRIHSVIGERGNFTTGDYRLLLGINAPEVLTGESKIRGRAISLKPIDVKTAIQLEQITGVDQKQASFGVIATLWMAWTDPALAFSPESCQCNLKTFDSIDEFMQAVGDRFPGFSFRNLRDDLKGQNQIVAVSPDGSATYFERFGATLSAPYLNLRSYPFDKQTFSIEIDSIDSDDNYVFTDWGKSNASDHLGNEEWDIVRFSTNASKFYVPQINAVNSRFLFNFLVQRHIDYYIFRIFVPILLIIILTWLTFFLHKDYMKRIEIVGANLLLFIAFNFTVASDLPKLGYLTFLDRIMISTFIMTAVIFAYNVYLRWLDMNEKKELAERLDNLMIWVYPLAYIIGFFGAIVLRFG
jgi:hypothetical protein